MKLSVAHPVGMICGPVLCIVCVGCTTGPDQVAFTEDLFAQTEFTIGAAERHTVLSGSFLQRDMDQLAIIRGASESHGPRVRMYACEPIAHPAQPGMVADDFQDTRPGGIWNIVVDDALNRDVVFVDVAHITGRDRLVTCSASGGLGWFDPDTGSTVPLAEMPTNYVGMDETHIPHIDITRDLNGDGRDDLVVPTPDGFWIATQLGGGTFTNPIRVGPPEPFLDEIGFAPGGDGVAAGDDRSYRDVGITALTVQWYLSRLHQCDYNLDGRLDLLFWNRDHFDVYPQGADGKFGQDTQQFSVDVPFDSDGVYSRMFEYLDDDTMATMLNIGTRTERTVMHRFHDMNGDSLSDLVTITMTGRTIAEQKLRYNVHFGNATATGLDFDRDAGATIKPRGEAGGMAPWGYASDWIDDFDGDGLADVMVRNVRVDFGGMARAILAHSVPLNLELFRNDDGTYSPRADDTRRIRPKADLSGDDVFFPAVLMGDINGDGRSDVLVGQSPGELRVYLGVGGDKLLAELPQRVAVALPNDERNTWLVDLNGDGKQDVLVYRPSRTGQDSISVLISR